MNLSKGANLILNIVDKDSGLGKTAVMKVMFMAQQVKGIETGYEFSMYTYGPYDADVMEDIDQLVSDRLIECTMYPSHNYVGYKLCVTDKGKEMTNQLSEKELRDLDDIVQFAKDKTAKELELYSTIIYIDNLYKKNSWGNNANLIAKKVNEIKPHFTSEVILDAYHVLQQVKYI